MSHYASSPETTHYVRKGKHSPEELRALRKIAKAHDCYYVYTGVPGLGLQGWMVGPNTPLNQQTAKAIFRDIEEAGLLQS